MPTRLDHLVVLVRDLEEAIADYGRLGFGVTPGGEHADGLTRNALVPFRDGTYLELVAFVRPEDGGDNVWGWRGFLPRGGLVDYCAASEGLRADVERLRGLGFGVEDLGEGGRRLPDGREIRWRSAGIRQEGRVLPFLIEDVPDRRPYPAREARPRRSRRRPPQRRDRHLAAGDLHPGSGYGRQAPGRPDGRTTRGPRAREVRTGPDRGRGGAWRRPGGNARDGRAGKRREARFEPHPRGPVHARARSR